MDISEYASNGVCFNISRYEISILWAEIIGNTFSGNFKTELKKPNDPVNVSVARP